MIQCSKTAKPYNSNLIINRASDSPPRVCLFYSLSLKLSERSKLYNFEQAIRPDSSISLQSTLIRNSNTPNVNSSLLKQIKYSLFMSLKLFSISYIQHSFLFKPFWLELRRIRTIEHLTLQFKFPLRNILEIAAACLKNFNSLKSLTIDGDDNSVSDLLSKSMIYLSEGLKFLKIRYSIDLSTEFRFMSIQKFLKNLKFLEEFTLLIDGKVNLQDEEFLIFCRKLKELESLKKLALNFNNFECLNYKRMSILCKYLEKIKDLSALNLNISHNEVLSDEGLHIFANSIHKLSQMESLVLTFNNNIDLIEESLSQLLNSISKLTLLKNLKLSISRYQLKSELFSQWSKSLKNLKNLKTLDLDYSDNTEITEDVLNEFKSSLKEIGPNLKEFSIRLISCPKINHEGVKDLIMNLNSLTKLEIDFSSSKGLKDDCLKNISENLQNNNGKLTSLIISLGNLEIEDNGLISLANTLMKFKNLESLNLNFCGSKIKTLDSLSLSLIQFSEKMKTLDLNFSRCKLLSSKEIGDFTDSIQKIKNLRVLNLNFKTCQITSELKKKLNTIVFSCDILSITI